MSDPVAFSVIVPAHQAATLLPDTLGALLASDFPRADWELVVADDASDDRTEAVARQYADRVVTLPPPSGGPSRTRNAAAVGARGEWLVFVDSDVRVHPDTLGHFAEAIGRHPQAVALFGCYDRHPAAPGLISVYRNLLHRYVHLQGAGPASTFWAGLGAIRREWFERLGGFDQERYPRQMEDIELGQRVRERGGEIVLDPTIEATHLKRWTLSRLLATDVLGRGVTWMRLAWERRGLLTRSLNIGRAEPFKVAMMGAALAGAMLAPLVGVPWLLLGLPVAVLVLVVWNWPLYRWFARERGKPFAAAVVPLHLLYYVGNVAAAVLGTVAYWRSRVRRGPRLDASQSSRERGAAGYHSAHPKER